MTWHYIFAKISRRLLKYQRLTADTHPATVEDQFESLRRTGQSECELPHILRPQRSIIIDEKEFARAIYAANVIASTTPGSPD